MNANNTSLLSSKAVLIRLFTNSFCGNMRDNPLTSEVQSNHGTEAKRVSVRKNIMQGKELDAVVKTLGQLRKTAERLSAPWLDGGLRIVSAKAIVNVKVKIEEGKREFATAVDAFIAAYDDIIARDRIALNGTFRATDYPSAQALRARFAARLEVFPIERDFRVEGVDEAVRAELQAEMEKLTAGRITDAKRELVERIKEKVAALANKCATATEDSRWHASTVTNIAEACAEVKAANFDDDKALDTLADSIAAAVAPLSVDALKEDENARADAAQIAKAKLAEIDSLMAGFVA